MFGLPGTDDASMRRFAAKVATYNGWRSVTYKGNATFDVDYRIEGTVGQDFIFPTLPDTDLILPFIAIRKRADGTVLVTAPGFAGGGGPFMARAKAMGMPGNSGGDGPPMRAEGMFVVTTDGEVLTNNTDNGPAQSGGGKSLSWRVNPSSTKAPEALVRL